MAEFDTHKGAFLLVALVIATQMAVIFIAMAGCMIAVLNAPDKMPGVCASLRDPISDMFRMSFTAAIAFAGGRWSAPPPNGPKLPPERSNKEK